MQKLLIIYVFFSFAFPCNIYSQQLKKPDKIKASDFSLNTNPIEVLFQRTLVTFPFKEDVSSGNVTDKQFKLSLEFNIRILIRKSSSSKDFQLMSKTYNAIPKIKYVDYYALENNEIKKDRIEDSEFKIEDSETTYYTNLSSLMKDSVAIIDLAYFVISERKDSIIILNNDKVPLHDIMITIDIPEIYLYKNSTLSNCFELQTQRKSGVIRGYQQANSNASITGKAFAEAFKMQFPNADFRPVYLKYNSNVYTWNNNCSSENPVQPLLKLSVSRITELK